MSVELFDAISSGDLNKVKSLVASGADVNTKNDEDKLPADFALSNSEYDIAQYLINVGGKILVMDNVLAKGNNLPGVFP